jgi:two-component sensor histidine kinase
MAEPIVEVLDFQNALSEVERANDALRELWVRCALPEDLEAPVGMCLEEILSNVIRHGCRPGQDCDIQVRYTVLPGTPGCIEVEVSDNARAFDPLTRPQPLIVSQALAGAVDQMKQNLVLEVNVDLGDAAYRITFH